MFSHGLNLCCAFRIREIIIEVVGHQELGPIRSIPDGRYGVLYSWGVSGGNIGPHDMPPPPPYHQKEADGVLNVEADLLNGEVLSLSVENSDTATMTVRRRRRYFHHPKAA